MKNQNRLLFFLIVLFSIANVSCDKFSGNTDSIIGAWRCREESGKDGFRQYSVSIYRAGAGFDSTYFIINNFHNLGYEVDTYVQLIDSVATIRDLNSFSISGEGHVSKDFQTIDWSYSVAGNYVTAFYFRK